MADWAQRNGSYRFDGFEVKPSDRILLRAGERVPLTPRQFDLLLTLIQADGHLVPKETLMREVWVDAVVEEGNLNRTISSLRKSLGEKPNEHRYIETVPKAGYRFIAALENGHAGAESGGQPTAIPTDRAPGKGKRWMLAAIGLAVLVCTVFGAYLIYAGFKRKPVSMQAHAEGPKRLTDNATDEDQVEWTRDGQIRFVRFVDSKTGESLVMNVDGSGVRRANDKISALQTGTWSPDGKRVIFRKTGEHPAITYLANADGSDEEKLPFLPVNMDWSADGKRIVYQANETPTNSELFIYDLAKHASTNISKNPSFDADPSFSPDGTSVTFVSDRSGNLEVYLMKDDGTGLRQMTNSPSREAFPVFSPDGTQLLFDSNRENENVDLYLMDVNDDAPPVKLTNWPTNEEHRRNCWSPDGSKVVFTSDRSGKSNIYIVDVEPSQPELLLGDEKSDLRLGSFSPDGQRLVYQARVGDETELRIYDVASGSSTAILSNESLDLAPAWSPAGDTIAFNCKAGGNTDICAVQTDGTAVVNLTNHTAREANPVWSPDGKEIVFSSDRDGNYERPHLFRMNADGTSPKRITTKDGYEMSPAWSRDGTMIAFAGDRMDGKSQSLDIFLVRLSEPGVDNMLLQRSLHDAEPAFSPDGKKLAFVAQGDGNYEIYLMNTDGTGLVRLTRNPADDTRPQFSPDGKRLLFSSNRGGKFALYEIRLRL